MKCTLRTRNGSGCAKAGGVLSGGAALFSLGDGTRGAVLSGGAAGTANSTNFTCETAGVTGSLWAGTAGAGGSMAGPRFGTGAAGATGVRTGIRSSAILAARAKNGFGFAPFAVIATGGCTAIGV